MVHLTVVTINAGQGYSAQLSEQVTIRDVAGYVSHIEPHINAGTLELARPVRFDSLLRDLGYETGDRLMIFTKAPRRADLPPPLRRGDRILRFTSGQYEVTSRGKRALLLGKPDDTQQIIPDVDLRYFAPHAPHRSHEYISRSCIRMEYDEATHLWYATRVGQTRVMIDELELGSHRVPLNDLQVIRLYRATDDVMVSNAQPIGEMTVRVETISHDAALVHSSRLIEMGTFGFDLRIGAERDPQHLNASEHLRVGQIVSSLAAHNRMTLDDETRVYYAKLLPPHTPLHSLNIEQDAFLYTSYGGFYTNNELHLRDVHAPEHVFRITAGLNDDESLIGCRTQAEIADNTLDVDLYDAVTSAAVSPTTRATLARQARMLYRARENSWWIRLDEQARIPAYVNNHRMTTHTPLPLVSGDVISIGNSVNHYYVRLEVEIISGI